MSCHLDKPANELLGGLYITSLAWVQYKIEWKIYFLLNYYSTDLPETKENFTVSYLNTLTDLPLNTEKYGLLIYSSSILNKYKYLYLSIYVREWMIQLITS